jgi:hypothetical protein
MQLRMTRFHGHMFLAAGRLYFICEKEGGAWMAAIGQGLGGAIGGALVGLAASGPGQAPMVYDEGTLWNAATTMKGSLIMDAPQITQIKETLFWRLIRFGGNTYGLPRGLGKELKAALGPWAKYHNVKTKGF